VKTKKAFTLVELLVVISIIALLLAILVPALSRARGLAKRIACSSLIRAYGKANHLYASSCDGWFVPFSQPHARAGYSWDERWPENRVFRKYISVSARKEINDSGWNDAFVWPKALRCPAQKIRDEIEYTTWILNNEGWKVIISYGLNVEQWRRAGDLTLNDTWWPNDGGYYGHSQARVKNPAVKMMFIDNNYYQARYERAKPVYWETHGDREFYRENMGQVSYRHNEGANLVFFDGHTEYLKKHEVHMDDPRIPAPHSIYKRYPNELWDIDKKGLKTR
jgi:prepilin-type N-terminal cleavage/methylation domain-containing protein/prepilin-type processing-associated H-X9-DG protein